MPAASGHRYAWRVILFCLSSVVAAQSAEQQGDALASQAASLFTLVAGEGYSIYTELTALIGAAATGTDSANRQSLSTSATTTPSASSSPPPASQSRGMATSRSASSPTSAAWSIGGTADPSSVRTSISSMLVSSSTLAASRLPTTVGAAVSVTTAANLAPPDSTVNHRLAAILVGSLLGAVVVGLLALLALLFCRRRERRSMPKRGDTPNSDEIRSWRQLDGHTSYAPIDQLGGQETMQSDKRAVAIGVRPLSDVHDAATPYNAAMHPAYRDVDTRELVIDRTHAALMKEMDIGDPIFTPAGAHPGAAGGKRKRHSIPRKPIPTAAMNRSSPDVALANSKGNVDIAQVENTTSPFSDLGSMTNAMALLAASDRSPHLRNDSRDALLADTDDPATGGGHRSSPDGDDTFPAALPRPSWPRQSTYTAYRPGVSASPHGPSDRQAPMQTQPTAVTAMAGTRGNGHHSVPVVPPRSPKRYSYRQNTPPVGSSSAESLDVSDGPRRQGADPDSEEVPMMWRPSADGPRMPPKGVTYHDFVPVRRTLAARSGAPGAAWGAVRRSEARGGRRASLDNHGGAAQWAGRRESQDIGERHSARATPTTGQYTVGQAL